MSCEPCEERRRKVLDALLALRIAEALRQVAIGAAEMVGVKEKGDGGVR